MSKRVLLIINPTAGQKTGKKYLADILDLFCRAGYIPTVFLTGAAGEAPVLVQTHAADNDLVVAIGGDGTFNETVSGLLASGADTPIGYIPCGSTNDFATGLGLKKQPMAAAKAILAGKPVTYDIGQFGSRYFTYTASFGAFTRASYATPQNLKNVLGHLAYILEGIRDLSNIHPIPMRIETDGHVFEDNYIFGAVSNSTSLGGVLTLDPDVVDMNDGLLELLLVKYPANILELNECLRCLQEKKYDSHMLSFHSTARLIAHADASVDWTLDGEHENGHDTVEIKNLHNAIRLVR